MSNKIKIYKVTAPFALGNVDYLPGDEFALPAGWNEENGKFSQPYTQTVRDQNGQPVKETFHRVMFLPVTHA